MPTLGSNHQGQNLDPIIRAKACTATAGCKDIHEPNKNGSCPNIRAKAWIQASSQKLVSNHQGGSLYLNFKAKVWIRMADDPTPECKFKLQSQSLDPQLDLGPPTRRNDPSMGAKVRSKHRGGSLDPNVRAKAWIYTSGPKLGSRAKAWIQSLKAWIQSSGLKFVWQRRG